MSSRIRSGLRLAKGWRIPIVDKYKFLNLSEKEKYGNSYLKEMVTSSPGITAFVALSTISAVIIAWGVRQQANNSRYSDRPFKFYYTVYRADDPRIERLRERPAYYNKEGTLPFYSSPVFEKNVRE